MTKRKYTIEATVQTLSRFCTVASIGVGTGDIFIHRVTPDHAEETYYVVLSAPAEVHDRLRAERFTNSKAIL